MLSKEEVKEIINGNNLHPLDMVKVIVKYIYDLKNVELDINNINLPNNPKDGMFLNIMYSVASNYYRNEQ
jgi:hypothetical protein